MSPWHIVDEHPSCPASKPFGVEKDDDGELEGCHRTRGDAEDQLAALYASERSVSMSETKAFGRVDVDIKAAKDTGEFEAVLSAPTEDRDGEIIDAKAFEPLPERIPIDVDHSMTVAGTVGSGQPFYDGDVLKFTGTFASTPLAQEVRTLVTEGHVTKMSVAFMNAERDDDDGKVHIRKAELLNAAIVAIPSNREASILAAKAALKLGARNSASDSELIQAAHDALSALGAECKHSPPGETATIDAEGKAAAPAAASLPPDVIAELAYADLALADLP